ncbi:hypothetical protein [Candidatus Tisiphia endosymbiont of Sialis lutaria]|uniref:hypothetical protein n=1 Tax=Candidatus Tisiphia endosymbiont of Sialis lutaria TaxID=2029164 RepID=UPI00312C72EA
MSYFLQPKRVKYRITLVIVGSLLEVTTSPTSPELTIYYRFSYFVNSLKSLYIAFVVFFWQNSPKLTYKKVYF